MKTKDVAIVKDIRTPFIRNEYADKRSAEVEKLINSFQAEGPFHGLGLFEVRRSTLVTMFSIVVTYIIIMVQFTPVPKVNDPHLSNNVTNF